MAKLSSMAVLMALVLYGSFVSAATAFSSSVAVAMPSTTVETSQGVSILPIWVSTLLPHGPLSSSEGAGTKVVSYPRRRVSKTLG
jgi:hypothetical protein